MPSILSLILALSITSAAVVGKRVENKGLPSFGAFVQTHGRGYAHGTAEYALRKSLYEARVATANSHNGRQDRRWTAGVNDLWDWTDEELRMLRGWRGGAAPARRGGSAGPRGGRGVSGMALLQETAAAPLPAGATWAHLNATRRTRNQGSCGSCWAVTSATLLDAHSEIYASNQIPARTFSTQEIVSCTPNPQECGGKGGCDGATIELALEWALKNGVATEADVPYRGVTGTCASAAAAAQPEAQAAAAPLPAAVSADSMSLGHSLMQVRHYSQPEAPAPQAASAAAAAVLQRGAAGHLFGMQAWEKLPENKYEPLMRALVERGPVGVSVAADNWFAYSSGIYDQCSKDAIIDHAVTLIGYGVDQGANEKYWLILNSWGQEWGEEGKIRLLRKDDDETEYCGVDNQPELGSGCKGGPTEVKVCGMCGILYDTSVPHFAGSKVQPLMY